jgi:hypothetical protein
MHDLLCFVVGITAAVIGGAGSALAVADVFRPAEAPSCLDGYGPVVAMAGLSSLFFGLILASLGLGWGVS